MACLSQEAGRLDLQDFHQKKGGPPQGVELGWRKAGSPGPAAGQQLLQRHVEEARETRQVLGPRAMDAALPFAEPGGADAEPAGEAGARQAAISSKRTDAQAELAAELRFRDAETLRWLDGIHSRRPRFLYRAVSPLAGVASLSWQLHRCSCYTQFDIESNRDVT